MAYLYVPSIEVSIFTDAEKKKLSVLRFSPICGVKAALPCLAINPCKDLGSNSTIHRSNSKANAMLHASTFFYIFYCCKAQHVYYFISVSSLVIWFVYWGKTEITKQKNGNSFKMCWKKDKGLGTIKKPSKPSLPRDRCIFLSSQNLYW